MMITNILKRASALVVAFFLLACTMPVESPTVPSANQVVAEAQCELPPLRDLLQAIAEAGGEVAHTYKGTDALVLVAMHNKLANSDVKGDTFIVVRKGAQGAVVIAKGACTVDVVFAAYADIMLHVEKALKGKPA